jgi:D-proline reductase (dithiol) PrdB
MRGRPGAWPGEAPIGIMATERARRLRIQPREPAPETGVGGASRTMTDSVDSFRFLDFITRKILKEWIAREPAREIPWTPLGKPLAACTVAAVSSGGVALKVDEPFDQEGERRNPWWGDPSYRALPGNATSQDVEVYHLHINPAFGRQDLNCLLPLDRLAEMEASGEIGRSAPRHYSYMGYQIDPTDLLSVGYRP